MNKLIPPGLDTGKLSFREGIKFIADSIYPEEGKAGVKKVRERARRACSHKKSYFSLGKFEDDLYVDTKEFYRWATDTWPELTKFNKVPQFTSPVSIESQEKFGEPIHVNEEYTYEELLEKYNACQDQLYNLQIENKDLKSRLATCIDKKKSLSEYGRQGGRGNEK